MHRNYQSPIIRQFRDQQVRFAPRQQRLVQAHRAEQWLRQLDESRNYTYGELCYRLTGFRPQQAPGAPIPGKELKHDLLLLIEDLTESSRIPFQEAGEPVWTVEELSRRFRVSTKTINRWRQEGLVSRRFLDKGRSRVGFLDSSVEAFMKAHPERIERGARFTHLSRAEKDQIIRHARQMAARGHTRSDVARTLARRLGRSVEAIRYTLKHFDQEHPTMAIFPHKAGPLTEEDKRKIYQEYRLGTSVEALAKRYGRTRTTIYRVINEFRARRVLELPLEYVPSPEFQRPDADKVILAPLPESQQKPAKLRRPSGLPPYLASLYEIPLLTAEQERHLFRKYNYLKYKAAKLRQQLLTDGKLDAAKIRTRLLNQIERLYEEAVATKNEIIQRNLRLVVSIAKRHMGSGSEFFELVSDGNMSLIRAVEKFDYTRGNKFSTYASWAIMKNFARSIPEQHKHRDRFRTSQDEMFAATADQRSNPFQLEAAQALRQQQVQKMLRHLDPREQQIIRQRFGLAEGTEPKTLKEVGQELGVTKERVRQLEARALSKLRKAAEEEHLELLELEE